MDIDDYINSGILHDYCINALTHAQRAEVERMSSLYPQVKKEIEQIQQALEKFANASSKWKLPDVQESIWSALENLNKEKAGNLNDLPLLNKYSDHNRWKNMVKPLLPGVIPEQPLVHLLRKSGGVMQVLMVGKTGVPDEVHDLEKECFLVLEGECECYIGKNVYRLGPGGFLEIPLHEHHNVKVISEYVVAVMQRIAV